MIEIRHKVSRAVLLRSTVDSLNGKNLTGLDLTSADLSGVSMCYACLHGTTLRLADLSGAQLCNAMIDNANLELANLNKADLSSAALLGTRLRGANLAGASLRYAQLSGAELQEANLENADLSMADLRANFREAILINADLRGANLAGANLQYANLTGADLTSANLEGAKLVGAKLQGARFDKGMQASARAVLSVPTIRTRGPDQRSPKSPLTVDFDSLSVRPAPRKSEHRSARDADAHTPLRQTPDNTDCDRLNRWRNCLRVRYVGGQFQRSLPIKAGAEGVVMEFFGPLGDDYWQIQFPEVGTVYVHRQAVEVLDHDFFADAKGQQESEVDSLLKDAKETVLYSTTNGKFKSLVIWYSDSRYLAVEEIRKAEMLIQLCKSRRIRMSRDNWFD